MSKLYKPYCTNWDNLPVVLDLKQVALILGVTDVTVKHLTYKGELNARKVGAQWRYSRDWLRNYIDGVKEI